MGSGGCIKLIGKDGSKTEVEVDEVEDPGELGGVNDDAIWLDDWDDFKDLNSEQIMGVVDGEGEGVVMEWEGSSDNFGRVIVYSVRVWSSSE